MRIYKYMPAKYNDDLIRRGCVLFRNLAYFRAYTRDAARSDFYEGRHVDRPGGGVSIENLTTGETRTGDFAFVNSTDTQNIYAFCLSMRLDDQLYETFNADSCVQISSIPQFVKDCRASLKRDHPTLRLKHGPVHYYDPDRESPEDIKNPWNLPFFKPRHPYSNQFEYRLVIAAPNSVVLKQRILVGKAMPRSELSPSEDPRTITLRLRGNRTSRAYMRVVDRN